LDDVALLVEGDVEGEEAGYALGAESVLDRHEVVDQGRELCRWAVLVRVGPLRDRHTDTIVSE
jgi:hypothetical protein